MLLNVQLSFCIKIEITTVINKLLEMLVKRAVAAGKKEEKEENIFITKSF